MELREIIILSIIVGFFLAYNKWYNLLTGLFNWFFASLTVFLMFLLFYGMLKLTSKYYGLEPKIERYVVIKKHHEKKTIFPLDIILQIIFGIMTFGYLFPIFVSIKFNVIETKRYGRVILMRGDMPKGLEPRFYEITKIILFSFLFYWMFLTFLKMFANNFIINAFYTYALHFSILFTISSLIPFSMFVTPIFVRLFEHPEIKPTIGDSLLFSTRPFYKATIISIAILPILSLILDPFLLFLTFFIIFGFFWLKEVYTNV